MNLRQEPHRAGAEFVNSAHESDQFLVQPRRPSGSSASCFIDQRTFASTAALMRASLFKLRGSFARPGSIA